MTTRPAVLFARRDTIYKTLDCDVWDEDRDALKWPGGSSVVAHPLCRLWSKLAPLSKAPAAEKELARFAVRMVREWGGCVEHPAHSRLWKDMGLPPAGLGLFDGRGWTLEIPQFWFGHRAEKMTWLYFVGIGRHELPPHPFVAGEATHIVSSGYAKFKGDRNRSMKPEVLKREREQTPPAFAEWLLAIARLCKPSGQ